MRAIALKMKSYAGSVKGIEAGMEGAILNSLILSLGTLAILYVFLLGNMVWSIIERKALEARARTLSTEVGEMELLYLSMSEKVDMTLSHSMGFKEIKPTYTTRKTVGSLNSPSSSGAQKANDEI